MRNNNSKKTPTGPSSQASKRTRKPKKEALPASALKAVELPKTEDQSKEECLSDSSDSLNQPPPILAKTIYFGNEVTETIRNYDDLHDYIYD